MSITPTPHKSCDDQNASSYHQTFPASQKEPSQKEPLVQGILGRLRICLWHEASVKICGRCHSEKAWHREGDDIYQTFYIIRKMSVFPHDFMDYFSGFIDENKVQRDILPNSKAKGQPLSDGAMVWSQASPVPALSPSPKCSEFFQGYL